MQRKAIRRQFESINCTMWLQVFNLLIQGIAVAMPNLFVGQLAAWSTAMVEVQSGAWHGVVLIVKIVWTLVHYYYWLRPEFTGQAILMYCQLLFGVILRGTPERSEDSVFFWQLGVGLFAIAAYCWGFLWAISWLLFSIVTLLLGQFKELTADAETITGKQRHLTFRVQQALAQSLVIRALITYFWTRFSIEQVNWRVPSSILEALHIFGMQFVCLAEANERTGGLVLTDCANPAAVAGAQEVQSKTMVLESRRSLVALTFQVVFGNSSMKSQSTQCSTFFRTLRGSNPFFAGMLWRDVVTAGAGKSMTKQFSFVGLDVSLRVQVLSLSNSQARIGCSTLTLQKQVHMESRQIEVFAAANKLEGQKASVKPLSRLDINNKAQALLDRKAKKAKDTGASTTAAPKKGTGRKPTTSKSAASLNKFIFFK